MCHILREWWLQCFTVMFDISYFHRALLLDNRGLWNMQRCCFHILLKNNLAIPTYFSVHKFPSFTMWLRCMKLFNCCSFSQFLLLSLANFWQIYGRVCVIFVYALAVTCTQWQPHIQRSSNPGCLFLQAYILHSQTWLLFSPPTLVCQVLIIKAKATGGLC